MTPQSVAVIGAGVAGLAAAKSLREEGLQCTVFEKSGYLGGLWHFDDSAAGGGGPAYRSLHTNISRHAMGYSDHPIPDSFPDFPSHRQIAEYLASYADRFDLQQSIRLQHEVLSLRRTDQRWELQVRSQGQEQTHHFDAAMVCSGRHQAPLWPSLEGREAFGREILHSMSYTDATPFTGKSVLVIGMGSSGVDLAEELAPVAHRTLLSTTRGAWLIPRTVNGRPADHNITRLGDLLPIRLKERILQSLIEREYRTRGIDLTSCPMPRPRFDLRRSRLTPGKQLARLIAERKVEVVPAIQKLDRGEVRFDNGRSEPVDAIIAATGYRIEFPFLQPGLVAQEGRTPRLYKHIFPPGIPGLAFIGVPWVIGAYPPVHELQARWASRVFAGRATLPHPKGMEARVQRAVHHARRKQLRFDRVQPIEYMDDLAQEIGCQPRVWRHPRQLIALLLGPFRPVHYRLDGPGRIPDAGVTIARGFREPKNARS